MHMVGLLAVLGACGPLAASQPIIGATRSLFAGAAGPSVQALDPRRDLSRALIESTPNELLLVAILSRDAAATAQPVGDNSGRETWVTPDGISLTFQDGQIIATRGLGDDLMGSDPSEATSALHAGGGEVTRINDYLGSQDEIIRRSFYCEIVSQGHETIEIFERTYATRRFRETCVSRGLEFENLYWIDGSGTIWQSRQWLSPLIGYLEYQRL